MTLKIKINTNITEDKTKNKLIEESKKIKIPLFEKHKEDLNKLKKESIPYQKIKNIIIVGYGGSNTSFLSYLKALYKKDKNIYILNTTDPDYLNETKTKCPINNTILILISKSGTTAGVLQTYLFFKEYKCICITENNNNPLSIIAKNNSFKHIIHPPVGGRFSGRTSCAYFPSEIIGLPIEKIEKGFIKAYKQFNPKAKTKDNHALNLAIELYLLEKKGYTEIFCPIYSNYLEGFQTLIMQLIHESSCKNEIGQTIYCCLAPESQHHTNQRFFGGRKNVCGLFITVKESKNKIKLKTDKLLNNIKYEGETLKLFNNLPLEDAFKYEYEGTYENAINKKIPVITIELSSINPETIGEFTGFLQYLAVYSSELRRVNPFDQPHVEDSKKITINKIKKRNK
jgi:glucose-6-phosphate isomerase